MPVFSATSAFALSWSNLIIDVICDGLIFLAFFESISALVLAGLPTTITLTFLFALSLIAFP